MTRLTNIARRASSTTTLGLVALSIAISGSMLSINAAPTDRLCGDRLIKIGGAMKGASGCLGKMGNLDAKASGNKLDAKSTGNKLDKEGNGCLAVGTL
jgi:hypothetical protein